MLFERFPAIFQAIANNRSNRKVEWQEYKRAIPNGYSYSQFASLFSSWCGEKRLSIVNRHWEIKTISETDKKMLMEWKRSNDKSKWAKAVVILESFIGLSITKLTHKVERSTRQIKKWIQAYNQLGIEGLTNKTRMASEKIQKNVRYKKNNRIKLIHETPKLHGINRASWGIKSLSQAYFKTYGVEISKSTISEYIRSEVYAFKHAKKILTSPDPLYRKKLAKITSILSNLKANEKFFSVRKNTEEMIRLVELLIEKYKEQSRIFFSWDAASWHASKKLNIRIDELNSMEYRKRNGTPIIELDPLPASAQFLNVIESIFSGMAKAIIHNSNYQSVDDCKLSIDLYFKERNEYFMANPKRAGNKIWGKEQVVSVFDEAKIYKDPKWR